MMRWIVSALMKAGAFLDRRFPAKMTVSEVQALTEFQNQKLSEGLLDARKRIALLEQGHNAIVAQIASVKLMAGIRTAMKTE